MAAEIKWIKISTNVFADEKILLIEQMPEGDSIIVIWFKLLCMAGKENNCGVFVMGNKIAYTDEMLATIFRRPLPIVRLALSTFEQFGMIEILKDPSGNNVVTIPNWELHQNIDGMDKIREQTRKRVAKHRENQRLSIGCNVTCNATVTECNATDKEKDKDKEEDKEKDKKKNNSAPYVADVELNSTINAFIEHRKKIKKPMTEDAIELLIAELNKLSPDIVTQIEILNQSIMNGWQGIFPLNNQRQKPTKQEYVPKYLMNRGEQRNYDYDALEQKMNLSNRNFLEQKQAAEERIKKICAN